MAENEKRERRIDMQETACLNEPGHVLVALHPCPLRENLYNDHKPYCRCCAKCAHRCEQDV